MTADTPEAALARAIHRAAPNMPLHWSRCWCDIADGALAADGWELRRIEVVHGPHDDWYCECGHPYALGYAVVPIEREQVIERLDRPGNRANLDRPIHSVTAEAADREAARVEEPPVRGTLDANPSAAADPAALACAKCGYFDGYPQGTIEGHDSYWQRTMTEPRYPHTYVARLAADGGELRPIVSESVTIGQRDAAPAPIHSVTAEAADREAADTDGATQVRPSAAADSAALPPWLDVERLTLAMVRAGDVHGIIGKWPATHEVAENIAIEYARLAGASDD